MATTYEKPETKAKPTLPLVASRLSSLRRQINLWFILEGLAYLLWCAIALAAGSFLLDYFFRLDPQQRTFLLVVTGVALVLVFARRVVRPLSTSLSDDALILEVERRHPELAESLISAVQFKRMEHQIGPNTSLAMVQATIQRGAEAGAAVRFADVINRLGLARNVLLLFAALVLVAGLVLASNAVPHIRIWFQRNILLQSVSYPQNTYLQVVRAENGKIRIPRGDDYTLEVIVTLESKVIPDRVFIDFRDGRSALAMKRREGNENPDGQATFEAVLANVIQPFQFRVRGGDERTDYVTVELVEPPAIDELQLSLTYPQYAGGKTEALPPGKGPYFILPGSSLTLSGTGNKPLAKAALAREGERIELAIKDGKQVSGTLSPQQVKTGQYAIELTDAEGLVARRPTTFGLRLRPDREPRVRARLVGVGGMVTARARLPLSCRVTDDYGLTEISVPFVWRGDDEQRKEGSGKLPLPEAKLDKLDVSFEDVIDLEPLEIPTSTGLTFYIAAADNDDYPDQPGDTAGPNIGKSPDFSIRVVTDEELRADLLRREKEQRQEFERLIRQQEELLTFSRELEAQLNQSDDLADEQKEKLAQTPKNQKLIATNTGSVAQRLSSIVIEIMNNRLEEGIDDDKRPLESRLRSKIVEPLVRLQMDPLAKAEDAAEVDAAEAENPEEVIGFPEAVRLVEHARRAQGDVANRRAAMKELVEHQEAVVAVMKNILSEMSQAEGFQEAVNLLYEVDKLQREVLERTKKAKEEREKGIIQGSGSSKPEEPKPEEPKPEK